MNTLKETGPVRVPFFYSLRAGDSPLRLSLTVGSYQLDSAGKI